MRYLSFSMLHKSEDVDVGTFSHADSKLPSTHASHARSIGYLHDNNVHGRDRFAVLFYLASPGAPN